MLPQRAAYLTIEVLAMLGIVLLASPYLDIRALLSRRFIAVALFLYLLALVLDLIAVKLGIFYFPSSGRVGPTILGLPIEEHLCLVLHTLATWAFVNIAVGDRDV